MGKDSILKAGSLWRSRPDGEQKACQQLETSPRTWSCQEGKKSYDAGSRLRYVVMSLTEKDWRDLYRLRRAVTRAEQALAELDRNLLLPEGLCASDFDILDRLARKGARPVNDLGRQVGLTSGSMTTAVQRLRRRNLVETRRDLADKRVVWVSVTGAGEELVSRFSESRSEVLAQVFEKWSERERSILTNLLKRVRKDAQNVGLGDLAGV